MIVDIEKMVVGKAKDAGIPKHKKPSYGKCKEKHAQKTRVTGVVDRKLKELLKVQHAQKTLVKAIIDQKPKELLKF